MAIVRKYFAGIITAMIFFSGISYADARSKFDIRSGLQVKMLHSDSVSTRSDQDPRMISVIFTVKEGCIDHFDNIPGIEINAKIGKVIVADVALDIIDSVMNSDDILYGQLSQESEPEMFYARMEKNANVNKAHGDPLRELGKAYLGKGVVCGVFDTGFDVNHITFYDNLNREETRVKRLVSFEGSSASPAVDTTDPDRIKKFRTDRTDGHHGSHVLGIMAGGFRGMGEWKDFDYGTDSVYHDLLSRTPSFPSHDASTVPVAYYGAAPQADIVLCGSRDGLYEGQQITSAMAVINYAREHGQPCVINHSFGSQWGPRDGSGSYGDLMDEFAEYAIICKAAGNDGTCDDYISETFTEDRPSVATILQFAQTNENKAEVEYWLSDNRPIKVELFFAGTFKEPGKNSRKWTEIPFYTFEPDDEIVDIENDGLHFVKLTPANLPAELKGAFTGEIQVGIGVAAQNNRYTVDIVFPAGYANNTITYNNSKSLLELGVRITGHPGQRVDGNSPKDYCKFSQAYAGKGEDYVGGSPCMSIAEGSCSRKCIAVGSYSARTSIKYLDGHVYYTDVAGKEGGNIAPSSGYGLTIDGRRLPHVAAPGVNIISAENRYYEERDESNVVARAEVNGETYDFIEMSGTSMACPLFAGICALWLEADPTLKYDDILRVLEHSCRHDEWTEAAPERFGYGKVDAYEGLKYVLAHKNAGIPSAVVNPDDIMIREVSPNCFEITVGGGETFTSRLISMQGETVAQQSGTDTLSFDLSSHRKGLYVLSVSNDKFLKSLKILIK